LCKSGFVILGVIAFGSLRLAMGTPSEMFEPAVTGSDGLGSLRVKVLGTWELGYFIVTIGGASTRVLVLATARSNTATLENPGSRWALASC